jgi:hypothetical protein
MSAPTRLDLEGLPVKRRLMISAAQARAIQQVDDPVFGSGGDTRRRYFLPAVLPRDEGFVFSLCSSSQPSKFVISESPWSW